METNSVYTSSGGIRTYLYLLELDRQRVDAIDFYIIRSLVKGWITMSRCTRDGEVSVSGPMNS